MSKAYKLRRLQHAQAVLLGVTFAKRAPSNFKDSSGKITKAKWYFTLPYWFIVKPNYIVGPYGRRHEAVERALHLLDVIPEQKNSPPDAATNASGALSPQMD